MPFEREHKSAMAPALTSFSDLEDRVRDVRERIDAAARRGGRTGNAVTLVAVTKTHGPDALQAAWDAHGEGGFSFETLEALEEDTHALAVQDLLKELKAAWIARLGALPLL